MQRDAAAKDRKMIPRWRKLYETPTNELCSSKSTRDKPPLVDHDEIVQSWKENPNPWTAADLISITAMGVRNRDTDDAADFLNRLSADLQPGIQLILRRYSASNFADTRDYVDTPSVESHRSSVRRSKRQIFINPRSAISYVEAARSYTSLGQTAKAREMLARAHLLAPNNRYVIRSATRFFVHEGEFDSAWNIVKGTDRTDPWLVASRVAVADLIGADVPSWRFLSNLLEGTAPSQSTELSAAIGTLELSAGNFKRAKKLFSQSAEEPTENSVAQLRWANETGGTPFDSRLLDVSGSFEARTAQFSREARWEEAALSASSWLSDEPFSSRAAVSACYINAEFREDYRKSVDLATIGLTAAPNDVILLNNRAYAYAALGDTLAAMSDLEAARNQKDSSTEEPCLLATEGFILYRSGSFDEADKFYKKSIDIAIENKEHQTAQRAYIHWIHEQGRIGRHLDPLTARELTEQILNSKSTTVDVKESFRKYVLPHIATAELKVFAKEARELAQRLLAATR